MGSSFKDNFSITNKTGGAIPRLPFLEIKNAALGENYELSLVLATKALSQKLNKSYRGKNKPTNILSFVLEKPSKKSAGKGEIFIAPDLARKEAPQFGRTYQNFIAFLFIHGLFHLKGMDHGSTMDRAEEKLRRQFHI